MTAGAATSPLNALVVAPGLGVQSEVWMYRQVAAFRRVRPHVLCWNRRNEDQFPLDGVPVTVLGTSLDPSRRAARWSRRVRTASSGNFLGTTGAERRRLLAIADAVAPQVVLCHFGHVALRMLPVARTKRLPLVAHFHGMDLSSMLRNRWYRWSLKRSLRRFAAVVVVGSHQRRFMIDHGVDASRVHLIPCGVPTDEFRPAAAAPQGPFRYITVGRLVEFKGIAEVIRAFSMVRTPEDELTVVGDGPDRAGLEALAKDLEVAERIRFLGPQPPEAVRGELQRSDVYLQHSLDGRLGACEGFGVAVSEAAACGLPVVVTACGGLPDQVADGKTGYVVAQRDLHGMAKAMRTLRGDARRRTHLGRSGRAHVRNHYDVRSQVEKLERVLIEAMNQHAPELDA